MKVYTVEHQGAVFVCTVKPGPGVYDNEATERELDYCEPERTDWPDGSNAPNQRLCLGEKCGDRTRIGVFKSVAVCEAAEYTFNPMSVHVVPNWDYVKPTKR